MFQITKDVHNYVRSGMVKTTSINFAQQAKRSASVGESAWKRLVSFNIWTPQQTAVNSLTLEMYKPYPSSNLNQFWLIYSNL